MKTTISESSLTIFLRHLIDELSASDKENRSGLSRKVIEERMRKALRKTFGSARSDSFVARCLFRAFMSD